MNADSLQQPQSKVPILLFVLVAVLVVLDQYSKYLCTLYLEMGLPVAVFPGLDLLLAQNKGAAFSFLDDAGGWQRWLFAGISVVVSMVLTLWLWRLPRQQQLLGFALA
jgi:signal peptidase II